MCLVGSDGNSQGEKEERPPDLPLLSEQLSLDELWDMLGECLKELEESHDQHAVLGEWWPEGTLTCSVAPLACLVFFQVTPLSQCLCNEDSKERSFFL